MSSNGTTELTQGLTAPMDIDDSDVYSPLVVYYLSYRYIHMNVSSEMMAYPSIFSSSIVCILSEF